MFLLIGILYIVSLAAAVIYVLWDKAELRQAVNLVTALDRYYIEQENRR